MADFKWLDIFYILLAIIACGRACERSDAREGMGFKSSCGVKGVMVVEGHP